MTLTQPQRRSIWSPSCASWLVCTVHSTPVGECTSFRRGAAGKALLPGSRLQCSERVGPCLLSPLQQFLINAPRPALPLRGHLSLDWPRALPEDPSQMASPHPAIPLLHMLPPGALPPALARHLLQRAPPHCGTVLSGHKPCTGHNVCSRGPCLEPPPVPLRAPRRLIQEKETA